MTGQLGDAVNELVKQFNDSQTEYEVKPLRKGTYPETLTAAIAAYRQKSRAAHRAGLRGRDPDHDALGRRPARVSAHAEQEFKIDWKEFIAPVVGLLLKDGNLYSMPFNSSTPILYYNKDAFQKAGLDPAKPPQTWKQVEDYSKKLIASGAAKCGFSTGWPSWTMVENMHAWHDQPFATKHNGFDGLDAAAPDQQGVRRQDVRPARGLAEATRSTPTAAGQGTADPKFVSGECAMYIQSSALIGGFTKGVKFAWGTGHLPHWGPPYKKATSIIGGATLWVMKGKPAAREPRHRPVPQVRLGHPQQMWWHATTGYLAISNRAVKKLEDGYHFVRNPDQYTAFAELTGLPLAPPAALAGKKPAPAKPERDGHRRTARGSGWATSSRSAT